MKPHSKVPIGLVALTLASIVLALLVFWSFQGGGLSVGSNINRSADGGIVDALSPATLTVFLLSLLATYWVGRQSGRLRSARSESTHGQLVDPSFLRAKASLEAAAAQGGPNRAPDQAAGKPPTQEDRPEDHAFGPDGWLKEPDKDEQAAEVRLEPEGEDPAGSDEIFKLISFNAIEGYGQTTEVEPETPGRRRLSTTKLMSELSPESRQLIFGRNDLRASPNCPVRASMWKLLGAIKDISHSSHQISQLEKTMDDFVFQANLLALEAAVEVGRPGGSSRGLATVASRSRRLAISSAEAARNTADLVANMQAQIQSGSEVVKTVAGRFVKPGIPLDRGADNDVRSVPANQK